MIAFINELIDVHQSNGVLVTTSRNVAEVFGKEHKNVIRDIENVIAQLPKGDGSDLSSGLNKPKEQPSDLTSGLFISSAQPTRNSRCATRTSEEPRYQKTSTKTGTKKKPNDELTSTSRKRRIKTVEQI